MLTLANLWETWVPKETVVSARKRVYFEKRIYCGKRIYFALSAVKRRVKIKTAISHA